MTQFVTPSMRAGGQVCGQEPAENCPGSLLDNVFRSQSRIAGGTNGLADRFRFGLGEKGSVDRRIEAIMKALTEEHLATLRRHMVEVIDIEYDLTAEETGRAKLGTRLRDFMLDLPRHLFVPQQIAALAYSDQPLPIGFDKTISQPFMSALMIDLLEIRPQHRVLEIGTGLGYQTALLAGLASHVWSIDIVEEFIDAAAERLCLLGRTNITLRVGEGSRGWPDAGPFDAILISAAARELPGALVAQLQVGGRMVLPLGGKSIQRLAQIERISELEVTISELMAVQFTELETMS